jgi:hypothetical protein
VPVQPPVVLPPVPVAEGTPPSELVVPQFTPFVVAPLLLRPPGALVVTPFVPTPVALVVVQEEKPVVRAAPPVVAVPAPAAPPALYVPKPYRN